MPIKRIKMEVTEQGKFVCNILAIVISNTTVKSKHKFENAMLIGKYGNYSLTHYPPLNGYYYYKSY